MKEILIYGALVASVLAASVPMIRNFVNTTNAQNQAINQQITTQTTALTTAIGTFGNTGGNNNGGG